MAADDERPPFLGSWRRVYLLVIGALAAEVVIGSLLSWIYR
jgi:hypothetical protein